MEGSLLGGIEEMVFRWKVDRGNYCDHPVNKEYSRLLPCGNNYRFLALLVFIVEANCCNYRFLALLVFLVEANCCNYRFLALIVFLYCKLNLFELH